MLDPVAFARAARVLSHAFAMDPAAQAEGLRLLREEIDLVADPTADTLARQWQEAVTGSDVFSIDHARLFIGPYELLAAPYASHYLEPEQQVMGEISRQVAQAYAEAGLAPGPGPREVPDHVSLECEFLFFLAYRWLEEDDPAAKDTLDNFLPHALAWMPKFSDAIRNAKVHPVFHTLANWMDETLAMTP